MIALLSASRLLVWRRCHVDICSLRDLFAGKTLAASEKAIRVPGTMRDEVTLEVAGNARDRPVYEDFGVVSRQANVSEGWHSVYRTGWVEGSYLSAREAYMRYMAGLAGAGHF
jgi:hypothetical protein